MDDDEVDGGVVDDIGGVVDDIGGVVDDIDGVVDDIDGVVDDVDGGVDGEVMRWMMVKWMRWCGWSW